MSRTHYIILVDAKHFLLLLLFICEQIGITSADLNIMSDSFLYLRSDSPHKLNNTKRYIGTGDRLLCDNSGIRICRLSSGKHFY